MIWCAGSAFSIYFAEKNLVLPSCFNAILGLNAFRIKQTTCNAILKNALISRTMTSSAMAIIMALWNVFRFSWVLYKYSVCISCSNKRFKNERRHCVLIMLTLTHIIERADDVSYQKRNGCVTYFHHKICFKVIEFFRSKTQNLSVEIQISQSFKH